jgi:hypothetical protein
MKNPLPAIARTLPIVIGPAFFLLPPDTNAALDYARRLLYFALLFGAVGAVKFLLIRMYGQDLPLTTVQSVEHPTAYPKRPLVHRRREIVEVLALIGAILAMIGLLQAVKATMPTEFFTLALGAIFFGAVEPRLASLRWPVSAAGASFIAASTVSALSLFLSTGQWLWQTTGVSLTCGFLMAALSLATSIEGLPTPPPRDRKIISRIATIGIALSPITLGVLVQLKALGPAYLLTFIILPLLSPALNQLKCYEKNGDIPRKISISVAAANLLVLVIVCGVSIFYRR